MKCEAEKRAVFPGGIKKILKQAGQCELHTFLRKYFIPTSSGERTMQIISSRMEKRWNLSSWSPIRERALLCGPEAAFSQISIDFPCLKNSVSGQEKGELVIPEIGKADSHGLYHHCGIIFAKGNF